MPAGQPHGSVPEGKPRRQPRELATLQRNESVRREPQVASQTLRQTSCRERRRPHAWSSWQGLAGDWWAARANEDRGRAARLPSPSAGGE